MCHQMEGEGYIKENLHNQWKMEKKNLFPIPRIWFPAPKSPDRLKSVFRIWKKFEEHNTILCHLLTAGTLLSTEVSLLIGNWSSLEKIFASDYCPFKEHWPYF